jgi:two-component system chemotaxis response regulator CheY
MSNLKNILILDDDFNFKSLLENNIRKKTEYGVFLASDGDQALEKISAKENKIDVLTTDLIHSGIGGIELLEAVKTKYPNIKTVICTGLPSLHEEFTKYADAILYKPLKFDDYLKVLKSLL